MYLVTRLALSVFSLDQNPQFVGYSQPDSQGVRVRTRRNFAQKAPIQCNTSRDEELLDHLERQLFQDVHSRCCIKGVLPDPVFTITIETLSAVEGGTLIPPKSAGAG